ncbi:hypothetical protein J6590_016217 [Homalodisca vitripennis]|nr:hypothetical protein J6590_016217 [Homalodisca vitripennis]
MCFVSVNQLQDPYGVCLSVIVSSQLIDSYGRKKWGRELQAGGNSDALLSDGREGEIKDRKLISARKETSAIQRNDCIRSEFTISHVR